MSTIVYTLTETNNRTGFVIAVFYDYAIALDVAQSHATTRIARCVASDARLQDGNPDPDAYAIQVEHGGKCANVAIVHVASGELDDCRWHIRECTVVEPATPPEQPFDLAHLPSITGRLAIKTFEDRIEGRVRSRPDRREPARRGRRDP